MRKKRNLALAGLMILSMLGMTVGCDKKNTKDSNSNSEVGSKPTVESNSNVESNVESNVTSNVASNTTSNTNEKVYSDGEVISKAINYLNVSSGTNINFKGTVENKKGNNVSIRIYEDMGDHIATSGLYTIDNRTLKGKDDLTGKSIDLNNPVKAKETKVYSDSEIMKKAINYATGETNANIKAKIEYKSGYNVSVRVYEDMEDHIATLGLYTVDSRTLKGTNDIHDTNVDLNNPVREKVDKVYSDAEVIDAAIKYYNRKNNSNIKLKGMVEDKDGNELTIRIYEDMEDHIATAGLYTINNKTLKGTNDFSNEKIDLNK